MLNDLKKLLIVALVLLLIIIFFSVLGIGPRTEDREIDEGSGGIDDGRSGASALLDTQNRIYKEETEDYNIEFNYPEALSPFGQTITVSLINKDVKAFLNQEVESFKKFAEEINDLPDAPPSELIVSYNIGIQNENFLSLEFIVATYMTGAAHPFSVVRTFNYNLDKNEKITLSNAFEGEYLDFFSKISAEKIGQMDINPASDWVLEGTMPVKENFESFLLTDSGITLIFDPYQVAPYAAGIIRVEILKEELSPYVDGEGTLEGFSVE